MHIEHFAQIDSADILRTLYDITSFQRTFDIRLCETLDTTLTGLGAEFVIARFGTSSSTLVYHTSNFDQLTQMERDFHDIDKAFRDFPRHQTESRIFQVHANGAAQILAIDLLFEMTDEYGKPLSQADTAHYCILGSHIPTDLAFEPYRGEGMNSLIEIAYALNFAFRYRQGLFKNFPTHFVKEYWLASTGLLLSGLQPSGASAVQNYILPPWLGDGLRRTATLSLDMRKSTFIMEASTDQKAYADWIEAFVLILQRIAKDNDGVFDKFTGDGVIVHFLADECRKFGQIAAIDHDRMRSAARWRTAASATGQLATRKAVTAGWEMIYAIQYHMKRLSEILGLHSRVVGPVVGIAIDRAQWSVDREGNIIVVGRGVVHACRLTVDPPALHMWMTNHAKEMLYEVHGEFECTELPFKSKEYPEEAGVGVVQLHTAPQRLCRPTPDIQEIVESIWDDMDLRVLRASTFQIG